MVEWKTIFPRTTRMAIEGPMEKIPTAESHPFHVGKDGFPMAGSRWRHHSGVLYIVLMMTNVEEARQDEFPTTVVYQSDQTGRRYSLALTDWWKKRIRPA